MQNIFTLETQKYSIKIDNFEGPLDLLCHLIDSNKMDIYDVNLNEITDQYIKYIDEMQKMDLEVTSEFLIMASNLLYIKSRKLLPRQTENNSEEMLTEEELLSRIIEYKQYKEISKEFSKLYDDNSKREFRKKRLSYQNKQLVMNIVLTIYAIVTKKLLQGIKKKLIKMQKILKKLQ